MTEDDKDEIREKGARKVWTLRDADPGATLRLYECPLTFMSQESKDLIDLIYLTTESKILPFPGNCWNDQPAWFVEAFILYKQELSKYKKDIKEDGRKNT